jgi:hypothetical protein
MSTNNYPSRPGTSQHMSPARALPTGLANLEKPEHIPEIQMPLMASFDPTSTSAREQAYYTSISFYPRD